MTVIELSDEQAAALAAKAAAQGLSLEDWFKRLANELPAASGTVQVAANIVLQEMRQVPTEIMLSMPKDGASEHDHYLYGSRKKEA